MVNRWHLTTAEVKNQWTTYLYRLYASSKCGHRKLYSFISVKWSECFCGVSVAFIDSCVMRVNVQHIGPLFAYFVLKFLVLRHSSLLCFNPFWSILSHYLTNLMHKICFTISSISSLYMFRAHVFHHQEVKIALHSLWYHHSYRWPSRARDGHLQGNMTIPEAV